MKRSIWAAVGIAAAVACTAAYAAQLKITNNTLWDIHYLYMSPSDQSEWGPDQLEDDILETGGTLTLSGVSCDTWDIKIVDEDQDECEIRGVKICGDTQWTITSEDLLECQSDD